MNNQLLRWPQDERSHDWCADTRESAFALLLILVLRRMEPGTTEEINQRRGVARLRVEPGETGADNHDSLHYSLPHFVIQLRILVEI
jgi:hypothetical protein